MKVIIVGFGIEGQQLANYFISKKFNITIADQKNIAALDQKAVGKISKKVNWICGPDYLDSLKDFNLIAFSPGVKFDVYQKIKQSRIPTTTQTQLFLENCKGSVIGVTGTNGKGTTSTFIYKILKRAGKRVYLGGNIGKGILGLLPKLKPEDWTVLELSSYQLRDLTVSPHIGVILNITSDHLDIHQTQENYINAKINMIRFQTPQDYAVINGDYPTTKNLGTKTKSQVKLFYKSDVANDQIRLPGEHNKENASAAKSVAEILKINKKIISNVFQNFKGLPHRLQKVAQIKNVTFIDDSISTTPFTTIAAINTFKEPKILILGGSKKSADYSEMAKIIKNNQSIKAIILIGQTGPEIEKELGKIKYSGKIIRNLKNIDQVVFKAFKLAQAGDIILLSPASASFDWFKNYQDRSKKYIESIQRLATHS